MGFKARKSNPSQHRVDLVNGVEGLAIYLNNYRIVGPKPWGGGKVVRSWTLSHPDLQRAIKEARR